jgi:hypothetical protein
MLRFFLRLFSVHYASDVLFDSCIIYSMCWYFTTVHFTGEDHIKLMDLS